jgi:hypothetical protein
MRVTTTFMVGLAGACGASATTMVQSSAPTVAAYESVRSGRAQSASGGDVQFCAGHGVVIAERARGRPSDDVLTQYRDGAVASNVKDALERDRTLDGSSSISPGIGDGCIRSPLTGLLIHFDSSAGRTDENEIGGIAHFARRRRFLDDLRTNPAHVTQSDGKARLHGHGIAFPGLALSASSTRIDTYVCFRS